MHEKIGFYANISYNKRIALGINAGYDFDFRDFAIWINLFCFMIEVSYTRKG